MVVSQMTSNSLNLIYTWMKDVVLEMTSML